MSELGLVRKVTPVRMALRRRRIQYRTMGEKLFSGLLNFLRFYTGWVMNRRATASVTVGSSAIYGNNQVSGNVANGNGFSGSATLH
jgi:hypothetical protein